MEWTAVIPNWNGARFLPRLLADLAAQTHPPQRILVIDNGSTDNSPDVAAETGAELIRFPHNTGFAHAVNTGIKQTATDLVAILNNDIELTPDWFHRLSTPLAADPRAWFATGKIYNAHAQRTLDGTFDALSRAACAWRCGAGKADSPIWNRPRRITSAPLTAALFRRSLFTDIGPLDERFESYLEDIDFGLRCALAGREGLFVPDAIARHWGSGTLGVWHPETVCRLARNQLFLVALHYPSDWPLRYGWPILVGQLLWGLVAIRHGRGVSWLRGKWQGCTRFAELRPKHPPGPEFDVIIASSESLIRQLQWAETPDWYWRLYFSLT